MIKFRCKECGFAFHYTFDMDYPFIYHGKPLCPKCMIEYLVNYIPVMEIDNEAKPERDSD